MDTNPDSTPLEDFWNASSLGSHNVAAFGARVRGFEPFDLPVHPLAPPGGFVPLPRARDDRAQRLFASRRSGRSFGDRPVSAKTLGRLLGAVGNSDHGALVPAAGGVDALYTYAFARHVEGSLDATTIAYSPERHGVSVIGECPTAPELRRLFSLECDGEPQLILVTILHLDELRRKYGDRALRFALQQVGHSQQNLGLRAAEDSLTAYVLGGALDREVLDALGLAHTGALVGGAMAVGSS